MNELKSMVIYVPETRSLFIDKDGFPKKECLYTLHDICKLLKKPIPDEQPWRGYVLNFDLAIIGRVKKYFLSRHILFVAPKIESTVYYGFTTNQDMLENYISRLNNFARAYKVEEKQTKLLVEGQFPLFNKLT